MKTKLPFLALLLSLFCFIGCSDEDDIVFYDGEIVGKWQLAEYDAYGIEGRQSTKEGTIIEFYTDGKFSWQQPGYEGIHYAEYRVEDNTLYKQIDEVKYVYEYKFKNNTLILELITTEGLFCGTGLMHYGEYKKVNK